MKSCQGIGAVLLGILGTALAQANVLNIENVGTAGNGIHITSPEFRPAGTPDAQFGLDTFGFKEELTDGYSWDVVFKVSVSPNMLNGPVTIAIDKDVCNQTTVDWTDFHITLGMGTGSTFMASTEDDGLYFLTNPSPIETVGSFANPPMFDEPNAPDELSWFRDATHGGIPVNGTGRFIFGVQIPQDKFMVDPMGGPAMAVFTLHQRIVPEPASASLLLGIGLLAAVRPRRHRVV